MSFNQAAIGQVFLGQSETEQLLENFFKTLKCYYGDALPYPTS
jgi:hypothetical protein